LLFFPFGFVETLGKQHGKKPKSQHTKNTFYLFNDFFLMFTISLKNTIEYRDINGATIKTENVTEKGVLVGMTKDFFEFVPSTGERTDQVCKFMRSDVQEMTIKTKEPSDFEIWISGKKMIIWNDAGNARRNLFSHNGRKVEQREVQEKLNTRNEKTHVVKMIKA
jgi:hypothetical protein